MAIVYLSR